MSFKNFRISRKLTIAFTAIFLVSAGASILVFENLVSISRLNVANRSSLDLSADTESLLEQMVEQQNAVRGFLINGDEAFIAEYQAASAAFTETAEHFKLQTVSAAQRGRVENLQAFMAGWQRDQGEPQIALRRAPVVRKQPPVVLSGELPLTDGRTILKEIAETQASIIADRVVVSDKAEDMAKLVLAGSAALEALIAIAMGLLLSRSVGRPISQMTQAMRRLAGGDTSITVPSTDRRDEVGEMAKAVESFKQSAIEQVRLESEAVAARRSQEAQRDRQSAIDNSKAEDLRVFVHAVEDGFNGLAEGDLTIRMNQAVAPEFEPIRATFNDSVGKLEAAMGSVVGAVGAIRVGLSEISVASGDLAQRTEQQAASLEETVAALGEVTHAVNETADSAQRAQATATTAQKNAERGGEVVGRAVEAMNQIEQSSDKIGRIIGVIDEIAFQTNLLALNAGVEAARAGDAGRGFAVVAQEVRGLAQRSAEAAKEIKELISTSRGQVEQGVALVTASGKSLGEIVAQVAEMSDVVAVIAKSAREQAVSLREVSTAADQMDKVTQQNAAMVEETTAAAQNLSMETSELAGLVERFKTSHVAPVARQPAPPRAVIANDHRPVVQMRSTGSGGAALKSAPAEDGWEEF